ncbi:hypothetical protein Nmel_005208 [Mimus melanotis]
MQKDVEGAMLTQSSVPLGMPFADAWSLELWALQNPKPGCNPKSRQRSKNLMGLRQVPSKKMWTEPCCGSLVFFLEHLV